MSKEHPFVLSAPGIEKALDRLALVAEYFMQRQMRMDSEKKEELEQVRRERPDWFDGNGKLIIRT